MDGKIAIIGNREKILPFVSVGVEIYPIDGKNGEEVAREALHSGALVILVEENIMLSIAHVFDEIRDKMVPAVIPIPVGAQSQEYGIQRLRELLIKAIGADIVGN